MLRLRALFAVPLLALAALSCSTAVAPRGTITLRVANGTCALGECSTREVLAFPANQPSTPGGAWSFDLGTVTGSNLCVTIPVADTFRVIGVQPNGVTDTALTIWTAAMPLALSMRDSGADPFTATPSTAGFVPDDASGWGIRLPQDTAAQPAAPCTP